MKTRTTILAFLIAAAGLAAGTASADGAAILKEKGCLGCHDFEKKKVGPAYKDVAAKYKGQADAVDKLTTKVSTAAGHPKVKASPEEVKEAVTYVLSK